MKPLALAGIAAAVLAAPLLLASPAAAHEGRGRGHDRHDRYDRGHDRHDDDDYRGERRRDRHYRDDRRRDRWDHRRHNGYWHDGRWFYGPPAHYRDDYRYDYRAWRRGDRLPRYYYDHYREVDWRRHHLRAPPRGYHYRYDDDRDEYLLVGIATGVILGIILAQ